MKIRNKVLALTLALSVSLLILAVLFRGEINRDEINLARLTSSAQNNKTTTMNVEDQKRNDSCEGSEKTDLLMVLDGIKNIVSERLSDFPVDRRNGMIFDENYSLSYKAYSMESLYQLATNGDPYAHFDIAKRLTPELWAIKGKQERANEYRELFQKISFHYESMFNLGLNIASQRLKDFYRQCAESAFCQQIVMDRETAIQNYFKWAVIYDNADRAQLMFSDEELENGYEVSRFFQKKTWLENDEVNPFYIDKDARYLLLLEVDELLLVASKKRNEVGLPSILTSKKLLDISAKIQTDIERICDNP